jgi:hypothetical protein
LPRNNGLIYLHIGFSKTGTTSLQRFFSCNSGAFRDRGVIYPEAFRYNNCHHKLFWLTKPFLSNQNAEAQRVLATEDLQETYKNFAREFDAFGGNTALFSSELFSNFRSPQKIESVIKLFSHFDLKIIVYLRRQDEYLISMYGQLVMGGFTTSNFTDFRKARNLDYNEFLSLWEKQIKRKNIIVRAFDRDGFYGGDIFHDLIDGLGLKWDETLSVPAKESNISAGPEEIEFKRLVNTLPISFKEKQLFDEPLKRASRESAQKAVSFLDKKERREILEYYKESNQRITEKFLNTDNELFSPFAGNSAPVHEDLFSGLTDETIVGISRRIYQDEPGLAKILKNGIAAGGASVEGAVKLVPALSGEALEGLELLDS